MDVATGGECFLMAGAGRWADRLCAAHLGHPVRDDEEGNVAKELLWILKGIIRTLKKKKVL